jgi:molecular chaperone GrpE (heat shock protein)
MRLNRARSVGFERGLEGVIKMLDTFDMAMSNTESWNSVDANWRMGVEYIYNEGLKFLQDSGIEIINPEINSVVDPNIHESVENIQITEENLDHTIANVVQKGYKTKEYIIRPAKVGVYTVAK